MMNAVFFCCFCFCTIPYIHVFSFDKGAIGFLNIAKGGLLPLQYHMHTFFYKNSFNLNALLQGPSNCFFYKSPLNPFLSYRSSTIFFYKNSFNLNVFLQGPSNFVSTNVPRIHYSPTRVPPFFSTRIPST